MKKKIIISVLLFGLTELTFANKYHLNLLSDTTPDLSSIEAFGHDIGDRWETNNEKAIALGYWLGKLSKYGSPLYFSRQWDDPIAFLNSNSYGMCSDMTLLLNAMGEGALGFNGRHHELGYLDDPISHTVPELEYDGALHFIDPSYGLAYCHYNNSTTIASLEDSALNPALSRNNLPSALARDSDGEGEIKAWLSYGRLDRTSDKLNHGEYSPSQTWIEKKTEGYYGVHTFDISIEEDKYYTRYWRHLDGLAGFNPHDFFWPHSNFGRRGDFSWNENDFADEIEGGHRANGFWGYSPNLSNSDSYEASNNTQLLNGNIYPSAINQDGTILFKMDSANFITGVLFDATVDRKTANDSVIIEASSSGGNSWFTIWEDESVGENISIHENISNMIRGTLRTQDLRHVTDYLVRVRLNSSSEIRGAGLNDIKLSTVTMLGKGSLPKLELGKNEISIGQTNSSQLQTKKFSPIMAKEESGVNGSIDWNNIEVWKLYAKDFRNLIGNNSSNLYTGLWKTTGNLGWVSYELDAPRAIKKARLGGSFVVRANSNDSFDIKYRVFNGAWSGWMSVAHYDWTTRNSSDARENQTHLAEWDITQNNVTKVEFRTEISGYPHLEALQMEIDYESKNSVDKPLFVTYCWTEYHENANGDLPATANGGITRTYRERVTALPHKFFVNTGGDIQPRMNWVSMNLEGDQDPINTAPLGYSDGIDRGDRDFIPQFKYDIGDIISIGKSITSSVAPSSGSIAQLVDGKITSPSDGQQSNMDEVVSFNRGVGTVEFIVDLGSVQSVGGVRVDSYRVNPTSSSFPEHISIEAMVDGEYESVGEDKYHSAKYAHNLWSASWSTPRNAYSEHFGSFPNYGLYSNYTFIPFDTPVESRYVKILVEEQNLRGVNQRFALSEIHIYDSLTQNRWSPKLAHHSGDNGDSTIEIEAESGVIVAPMVSTAEGIVSSQYNSGSATYSFSVPEDGVYTIWGRYIASNLAQNSFFVEMDGAGQDIWDMTPLSDSWRWGKITGRATGSVLQFNLTAGEHTLVIRGREKDSALDKIIITDDENFVPSENPNEDKVVYEDAEDGDTQGWIVYSNNSGTATIRNIMDNDRGNRVIELSGEGRSDGYALGSNAWWNDRSHDNLRWSMNYSEDFTIYISTWTTNGHRYLVYRPINNSSGLNGESIGIGLGTDVDNGVWRTISRNIAEDIANAEEDNELVSINAFFVRGSGRIDDIESFQ